MECVIDPPTRLLGLCPLDLFLGCFSSVSVWMRKSEVVVYGLDETGLEIFSTPVKSLQSESTDYVLRRVDGWGVDEIVGKLVSVISDGNDYTCRIMIVNFAPAKKGSECRFSAVLGRELNWRVNVSPNGKNFVTNDWWAFNRWIERGLVNPNTGDCDVQVRKFFPSVRQAEVTVENDGDVWAYFQDFYDDTSLQLHIRWNYLTDELQEIKHFGVRSWIDKSDKLIFSHKRNAVRVWQLESYLRNYRFPPLPPPDQVFVAGRWISSPLRKLGFAFPCKGENLLSDDNTYHRLAADKWLVIYSRETNRTWKTRIYHERDNLRTRCIAEIVKSVPVNPESVPLAFWKRNLPDDCFRIAVGFFDCRARNRTMRTLTKKQLKFVNRL